MTALFAIIIFFFLFVAVYSAISVVLTAAAWWMTKRARGHNNALSAREIGHKIDRLKEKTFFISIVLTFFVVTPFVVAWVFIIN